MVVRDPTPSETNVFGLIDAILRRTQAKILRGQISEIRIPSGTLARSSSGRLLVYPNLQSLTTDTLTDSRQEDARGPRRRGTCRTTARQHGM